MLLFVVEDRFQIEGRGCILVPGVSRDGPSVGTGDPIRLRTPNGKETDTEIRALEMVNYLKPPEHITAPVLLPPELKADHVPIGTEVYLLDKREANPE